MDHVFKDGSSEEETARRMTIQREIIRGTYQTSGEGQQHEKVASRA